MICPPPSPNPDPAAGGGQGPQRKLSLGSHLVPLLSRLCKFLNLSSFQLLLCKVITLTISISPGCYEVQSYTKRPSKRPCHTITTGSYCFSSYHPIILYPQLPSEGGIPLCQFSLSSGGNSLALERGVSGWHLILTVGVEWEWSLFSKEEDTGSMASSFQAFGKPQ